MEGEDSDLQAKIELGKIQVQLEKLRGQRALLQFYREASQDQRKLNQLLRIPGLQSINFSGISVQKPKQKRELVEGEKRTKIINMMTNSDKSFSQIANQCRVCVTSVRNVMKTLDEDDQQEILAKRSKKKVKLSIKSRDK